MKRFLILLFAYAFSAVSIATTTDLWSGSKSFSSWSDVLNIAGSKFSKAKADNIIRFTIQASASAQLQVSYGNNWTNFEGLSKYSVTGDYDMILTNQMVSQLKQGIHIKGVNYTLTKISLLSFDEAYSTQCTEWFQWDSLQVSGGAKGSSMITLHPYSGMGWYWPDGINLGEYKTLTVSFLLPTSEPLILQVLYGNTSVKKVKLPAGTEQYDLSLTATLRNAYSVNLLSEAAQTVALGSVNLTDKDGNTVITGIETAVSTKPQDFIEYYNLAGQKISSLQQGINVVRTYTKDGHYKVCKVLQRSR